VKPQVFIIQDLCPRMISISDKEPCKRQRVGEKFPKALAAPAGNQFRNHVALRTYILKCILSDNRNHFYY